MSYHRNFKIKHITIPLLSLHGVDLKGRFLDSQIQYKTAFIFPITSQTRKFSFLLQLIEINISSYRHVYICWDLGLCRCKEVIIPIQTHQSLSNVCMFWSRYFYCYINTAFQPMKYSILKAIRSAVDCSRLADAVSSQTFACCC